MEENKFHYDPYGLESEQTDRLELLRHELTNLCRQFDLSGEDRYPGVPFSKVMLSQIRTLFYDCTYVHSWNRRLRNEVPHEFQIKLTLERMYQMIPRSINHKLDPHSAEFTIASISRKDLLKTGNIPRRLTPHSQLSHKFMFTTLIVADIVAPGKASIWRTLYRDSMHMMFANCVIWLAEICYLLQHDATTIGEYPVEPLIGRIDGLIKGLALIAAEHEIRIKAKSYTYTDGCDEHPDVHLYYPEADLSVTGIMRDNTFAIRGFADRCLDCLLDPNLCDWPR